MRPTSLPPAPTDPTSAWSRRCGSVADSRLRYFSEPACGGLSQRTHAKRFGRNQSRWLSLAAAAPPHPCRGREEQDVVILGKRSHPAPPTQHGSAIAAPEIRPP
jgi:hypothetical protein